jgi:general stress protein YciG
MSGTREGGLKAAEKNRATDPLFYKKIGTKGGIKSRGGGFAQDPELAREMGAKGGKASRRGKATPHERIVVHPEGSTIMEVAPCSCKVGVDHYTSKQPRDERIATELPKPIDVTIPVTPKPKLLDMIRHLLGRS